MSSATVGTDVRSLLWATGTALLDERRQLRLDELAALAAVPDRAVPSLAALAHEVRLAWCGDTVEVEGIISAKNRRRNLPKRLDIWSRGMSRRLLLPFRSALGGCGRRQQAELPFKIKRTSGNRRT